MNASCMIRCGKAPFEGRTLDLGVRSRKHYQLNYGVCSTEKNRKMLYITWVSYFATFLYGFSYFRRRGHMVGSSVFPTVTNCSVVEWSCLDVGIGKDRTRWCCPAGKYSPEESSSCLKCEAGKISQDGASSCETCQAS